MRSRRIGLAVVTAGMLAFVTLHAQIPGRNVNMVSGTGWPIGDPFLQRQNEPAVAASSRNPLHLLGGSNDYRSVDVPGLLGIDETGDAWLGLYKSFDGGQRWTSSLLPGYPYDPSPDALTSPLRGYQAGADAVVRAGAAGMFYFSGMVFDRVENGKSAIFVARFIDNNNKETGDPIKYLGASLVAAATGAGGVSYDKPWMAVDIPRSGAGFCNIVTRRDNGSAFTQRIPAGNVYVAYTAISGVGVNTRSQIYFTRSTDCGATWSAPVRISQIEDPVNQGATIAIDPRNGNVYVAWRRFGLEISPESDSIVAVRSLTQGRSFERPNLAKRIQDFLDWLRRRPRTPAQLLKLLDRIFEHRFKGTAPTDVDNDIAEFDQTMSEDMIRFRTNAYPTMTFDGSGRLSIAWAERRPNGAAEQDRRRRADRDDHDD